MSDGLFSSATLFQLLAGLSTLLIGSAVAVLHGLHLNRRRQQMQLAIKISDQWADDKMQLCLQVVIDHLIANRLLDQAEDMQQGMTLSPIETGRFVSSLDARTRIYFNRLIQLCEKAARLTEAGLVDRALLVTLNNRWMAEMFDGLFGRFVLTGSRFDIQIASIRALFALGVEHRRLTAAVPETSIRTRDTELLKHDMQQRSEPSRPA